MTDIETRLAEAEVKIEMLNNELYGLMAITGAVLEQVFDDPHGLLNWLRSSLRIDDEQAAIDAVADLVEHASDARANGQYPTTNN